MPVRLLDYKHAYVASHKTLSVCLHFAEYAAETDAADSVMGQTAQVWPLRKEVSIRKNRVWLTELVVYKAHDKGQLVLVLILQKKVCDRKSFRWDVGAVQETKGEQAWDDGGTRIYGACINFCT
jgi:hypothetical protein